MVTVSAPAAPSTVSELVLLVLTVIFRPAAVMVAVFAPVGITFSESAVAVPTTDIEFASASTLSISTPMRLTTPPKPVTVNAPKSMTTAPVAPLKLTVSLADGLPASTKILA